MRESGPNSEVSFSHCCNNILTFSFLFPAFGCYPYSHVILLLATILNFAFSLSVFPHHFASVTGTILKFTFSLSLFPHHFTSVTATIFILTFSFLKTTVYIFNTSCNSPGKIKRREVSWTLRKKLAQKRSRAGRWCWARERERALDFFCFSCFPSTELRTLSLWLCSA